MRRSPFRFAAPVLFILAAQTTFAYSVLSHEALVDSAWEQSVVPVLKARYPATAPEELRKAHAYAYGGAIIQDMGYYPFGSHFFSDLTHYVRSGDFVVNMIADAQDVNELAFALGALAHYAADNGGHPSVNRSVPLLYPKLRAQFGNVATYEDNPADHLKVEFAFDVSQVAEGHYAPDSYHDFIGFEVSKSLLERAFAKTYGMPLHDITKTLDLAIGTYRFAVSSLIPEITKVAWRTKRREIQKAAPGVARQKFIYTLSRAGFNKEFGSAYERPGGRARFLAFLFRLLPKVGPLRALAFHPATPEAQKLFMEGFVKASALYTEKLASTGAGRLRLSNNNFDTGEPAAAGKYRMADETFARLVEKRKGKDRDADPELTAALSAFYVANTPPALR